MNIVLPHKLAALVRKDGLSEITMRAWMESITESAKELEMLDGSGSPEGIVFAKKKKMYFNTSGAPGSRLYIKTTDITFNTGWELVS